MGQGRSPETSVPPVLYSLVSAVISASYVSNEEFSVSRSISRFIFFVFAAISRVNLFRRADLELSSNPLIFFDFKIFTEEGYFDTISPSVISFFIINITCFLIYINILHKFSLKKCNIGYN